MSVHNTRRHPELSLGPLGALISERLKTFEKMDFARRLARKDASLWNADAKAQVENALGWLTVAQRMQGALPEISDFVRDIKNAGFRHVLLMGMGGSSLAASVLAHTFTHTQRMHEGLEGDTSSAGGLSLRVLDTTDPRTIQDVESHLRLSETLFIVATKSGTTAEPLAFFDYFYARVRSKNPQNVGKHFVVITDPGTPLVDMAKARGVSQVFLNFEDIGGRYSALSYFGVVPAGILGVDISTLLNRAVAAEKDISPGLVLGAVMGEFALQGRDKMTLVADLPVTELGLWVEQLVAESTGKAGKGVVPIVDETLGSPSAYGDDRWFVHICVVGNDADRVEHNKKNRQMVDVLAQKGFPVVRIFLNDRLDLGSAFFDWQIATVAAGSILGINPFDQPDVQASKENTHRLLARTQPPGAFAESKLVKTDGALDFHTYGIRVEDCRDVYNHFLATFKRGDYVALLAYLPEDPKTHELLQAVRDSIRQRLCCATTLGYGPRFLHSTGQLHKGGPNKGLFIVFTSDNRVDLPIPGRRFSFGSLKQAQCNGDIEALIQSGRRVLRVHLGQDVHAGLSHLKRLHRENLG